MPRRTVIVLGSIAAALLLVAGAFAAYALRPTAAPSGELTAIPVLPSPVAATAEAETASGAEALAEQPTGTQVFEISAGESEARFVIDEVLNGADKTVVGVTANVAGQILVDPADLSTAQVGVIQVNVRSLSTDSGNRNRAIQNLILQTGSFEFVTFTPTQISGLPAAAVPGDTVSFQLTGDLTVRDITRTVTFDVSVTAESATRLSGLATTTINRADYGLQIPSVPQVAFVAEDLQLQLEFVAQAQ